MELDALTAISPIDGRYRMAVTEAKPNRCQDTFPSMH